MTVGSSLPAAQQYLVTNARALPECKSPVVVSYGWPTTRSDSEVAIGITPEQEDAEVAGSYAELSQKEYEDVELPCIVSVHKSGSGGQAAATDAAFAIYDALRRMVAEDRRFGGAIVTGTPARIARYRVTQTATASQAGEGRVCEVRFVLAWQHRG